MRFKYSAFAILTIVVVCTGALAQQDARGLRVRPGASPIALDGKGSLWAVVIGVSSYKNLRPDEQLRFAHRDAEDFAAFLKSPNGGGFPASNIKLLLNQQATLASVRTALGTWLPRSGEPDDVVYIFFAGHGVVESERDGYLLAYDSDPQNLYATALSVAELDTIVRERVRARNIVLIADACHAGRLGWQSRGERESMLINTYLDEVGKSGSGLLRILASRADQRSFEDTKWGGGHGAFTYFLLQGLQGKADKDGDHFVRASELLDYLGEVVPAETQSLQHPRAAGNIDLRLPLAVVDVTRVAATQPPQPPPSRPTTAASVETVLLELRTVPGSDVYVDKVFRGRIRPDGSLVVDKLERGSHEVSVDSPGAPSLTRTISLSSSKTILDMKPVAAPAVAEVKSTPLVLQVRQSLEKGLILERGGAWALYQQLVSQSPKDPQRSAIEIDLASALEEIGQQAINNYVNAPISGLTPDTFHRAAVAYNNLKQLSRTTNTQLEAKRLFCEGRALIVEGRKKEAIQVLEQAVALDPKAAYSYNALGVAYEGEKKEEKASDSFRRAADLAPNWELPRIHIGIQYYNKDKFDKAEEHFKRAKEIDPRDSLARVMLVRTLRGLRQFDDAEREGLELIQLMPRYAQGYIEIGIIYEASKQYSKAADAFETYLRLDPNSKDATAVRERIEANRRTGGGKKPSLKKN